MNLFSALKLAPTTLRANLGRSLLTMLGIIIGVAAVALVVTLGQSARGYILNQFEGIGANTVIVRPGRQPTGPTGFAETLLTDSLKDREVAALNQKDRVPGVTAIYPAVFVTGAVTFEERIYRPTTLGWSAAALTEIFGIDAAEGELFTEDDIAGTAKVAVIGAKVKEELFGDSTAIGQFITVGSQKLRVVGVLAEQGQVSLFNVDEVVLIPTTTAQKLIRGINHYDELFIKTESAAEVDAVSEDIKATLRELHNITNPDKDDFFVTTQAQAIGIVSTVTLALTVFLVAIAAIALVVGGVGIMNIMLVSVTERTGEIGLRKAVGATNRDILQQFLMEAVVLTVSGGIIGTIIAISVAIFVTLVVRNRFNLDWPFTFPWFAIFLGVGVSTAIGLAFGIFPARRAAKKDPIEALRYE